MLSTNQEKYLSAREIANILGLSENWVQRISSPKYSKAHRLSCYYFGRAKRFLLHEVKEYFKDKNEG